MKKRKYQTNPITKMLKMEKKLYKGSGMKPTKGIYDDAKKFQFEGAMECARRKHKYGNKFATHSKFPKGELH